MSTDAPTPTDDILIAFDRGLLPDEEIAAVTRWLESSPEAEERMHRLTQGEEEVVKALGQPCPLAEEISQLSSLASQVVSRVLAETGSGDGGDVSPVPAEIRDYQLLRLLGQGGMGHVHLARHTRLKRDVALKVLPARLASDPSYRSRFEREMAVLGQLDHPHLVRAYDAGAEGEYLFLAMELLDGEDLRRVLEHRGPLPVADACEVVRQAALGLHRAHKHGMVHRDVKPGNLFLTRSGTVKVIDLGLARVLTPELTTVKLSSVQTVLGTAEYMAPEQWDTGEVDRRADLYGLGCTLYCLLTGSPPFGTATKASWGDLVAAHKLQSPPSVRDRRPDVPRALDQLVARLLAKAPDQRPQSAREVAEALAAFTGGHDLQALPEPAVEGRQRISPALENTEVLPARVRPVPPGQRGWLRWVALALLLTGTAWAAWYFLKNGQDGSGKSNGHPGAPPAPVVLKHVQKLTRHAGGVLAVAFSPNGKVLASAGQDRTIILWDAASWQVRATLPECHSGHVFALAFSPDGAKLASVTDANDTCCVRLWDVATAKPAGTLGGPWSGMYSVAWSPDGTSVACAGWGEVFRILDVATGEERLSISINNPAPKFIRGLAFSPRGDLLATGGSGATRLWDVKTRREIPTALPEGLNPSFLPTGDVVGWDHGLGRVTICDMPSGQVRTTWKAHPGLIDGLAVSPDGRFLASLSPEGVARVWATPPRGADQVEVATLIGHTGSVYAAAFAPDGARLATAGLGDGTIRIWDLPPICHVRK